MADQWLTQRLRALRGFMAGEQQIQRGYTAAAASWAGRVRAGVMAPFRRGGQAPDPSMVLAQNDHWQQELRRRLAPGILDTLRNGWANAIGQPPPTGFDQSHQAQQHLTESVNRMVRMPDEVYREIAAIIADGINEGQSIPDIAARVDELLTVTGSENWRNRALVVARTETGAAMNRGALFAAQARQEADGVPYDKVWLATVGGTSGQRTRPSHRKADGQRVPLEVPFAVGEAQLMHPGDQTGPANEVIQCRCSILVLRRDELTTSLLDRQNP